MSRYTPEKPSPLIRPPTTRSKDRLRSSTCLTPLQHLKQKFEKQLEEKAQKDDDDISPVLYNLRNTPVKNVKEKRKVLVKKHDDSRKRCDQIKIGGGVTLWPEMDNMRLRSGEIIQLIVTSVILVVILFIAFYKFHGSSLSSVKHFTREVKVFSRRHPIFTDSTSFNNSILLWHKDYRHLIKTIESEFDMSTLSPPYQIFVVLYISAILVLIYFLIDNIFSKNKLSPRRIKNWVRLLVLVTTWTLFISYWLIWAYRLEQSVQNNILQLTDILGEVLEKSLHLDLFNNILLYWRIKCLPPTGRSIIHILGVLQLQDVIYYLQYYSLPILTVLLTPIVKLILALSDVYSWKKFKI